MDNDKRLEDFIAREIKKAEGDRGEAAYWLFDALTKGYNSDINMMIFGSSGRIDDRRAFKKVTSLFFKPE